MKRTLIFVGFPDSHAVSQGFWKIQVGRSAMYVSFPSKSCIVHYWFSGKNKMAENEVILLGGCTTLFQVLVAHSIYQTNTTGIYILTFNFDT